MSHLSLRGTLFILIASIFFASMGACLKYALQEIPLYQAVFFRAVISSLILGVVIQWKRLPLLGENRKILLARSLAGFVAMSCTFYALAHLTLADAAVLHQTAPLFVALFSILFLAERVSKRLITYLLWGLLGAVFILRPEGDMLNKGGFIALLGAAFAGLAYVCVRHLHRSDSAWVIAFHFASITALLALPLMIWHFVPPHPQQWAALLGAGLLGTGGQVFMTMAYRYEEASRLAPFSYLGVGLSFMYGIIFWKEVPDIYTLIGSVFILFSAVFTVRLNLLGRRPVALGED